MVIVDISGYTSFIKAHSKSKKSNFIKKIIDKINDGHGEHIISDLLETVINELDGPLQSISLREMQRYFILYL